MIAEKVLEKSIKGLEYCSKDRSLDDYLDSITDDRKVRSKVSSILFSYFRKKLTIEFLIGYFAEKKPKSKICNVLSVTITQILYQDSIENEVAVYVAVNYIKKRMGSGTAGFVNAVLRKIVSNMANIDEILDNSSESVKRNIPDFVLNRWRKSYTKEEIENLINVIKKPEEYIYFRKIKNDKKIKLPEGCETLNFNDFETEFMFYRFNDTVRIIRSEELRKGEIYIQDPATSMAVSAIKFKGKGKILDGCSAPGGKTLMLAELYPDSQIIASDRSGKRLEKVKTNVKKTEYKNVKTIITDMVDLGFKKGEFDVVFLDVPCSNSGVLRKRPDVLWKLNQGHIDDIINLQWQILDSAKRFVKNGGKLVYSTCSIEYDENEGLIKEFLGLNNNFKLEFQKQLIPKENNDGAFAAVMIKV